VLGEFTDPKLPARNVDVAFFHDVLHHVQNRAPYLKTLAGTSSLAGASSSSTSKAEKAARERPRHCRSHANSSPRG
jgi:hypothetical protein